MWYLKSNKNEANIIEREKTKIYISALAMQQSALTDETNVQGQVKRRRTLNIYARRILASLARSWPKRRERAPTAHTGLVPHSQFVRNITGEVRRKRE